MRIIAITDIVVPIASSIRNAYIDFSTMTASVVAIHTDVKRDGRPVVGFGFNSNGRYAQQALLRERFIPRLKHATPDTLLDGEGAYRSRQAWAAMMENEKPGGHGERSVAVGVLDMALWDAVCEGRRACRSGACWPTAISGGEADDACLGLCRRRLLLSRRGRRCLVDEMKRYLDLGYTTVKMKIGGVARLDAADMRASRRC